MRKEQSPVILTKEGIAAILFDSFEISQGSPELQEKVFALIRIYFPNLIYPAIADREIVNFFYHQVQHFLTDGKTHESQSKQKIHEEIYRMLETLSGAMATMKYKDINARKLQNHTIELLHNALYMLVERDLNYLTRTTGRHHTYEQSSRQSFVKKYFVEGYTYKNIYTSFVLSRINEIFEKVMAKSSHRNVDMKTIRRDIENVAEAWERHHAGQSFWEVTTRQRIRE